ncbi:MAG: hypothetical protein KatS3mg008_0160 [Acidimicrobiales bacterium]|nr:MAG: hypothetical protein KatS3mg008_0160 [Acidimicrobiales bacterium]
MTVVLLATAAVVCALGTYLLLGRQLSRAVIGISLLSHGVNLVLLLSARGTGSPPIYGEPPPTADPLPQAFLLTAIVITFGVVAFLLTLAYRSWLLDADDVVEDDLEDRRVARAAVTRHAPEVREPDSSEPDLGTADGDVRGADR